MKLFWDLLWKTVCGLRDEQKPKDVIV